MIVYLIVNKKNGKCYVGQTHYSLDKRWNLHVRDAIKGDASYFHKSIRKHGAQDFALSVLNECKDRQEAKEKERFWICFLQTYKPSLGYNKTFGGEGGNFTKQVRKKLSELAKGRKPSQISRIKMSLAKIGSIPWNKGKRTGQSTWMKGQHHSEEVRTKIREARKRQVFSAETRKKFSDARKGHIGHMTGKPSPMRGKHYSEEVKNKNRNAQIKYWAQLSCEDKQKRIEKMLRMNDGKFCHQSER